MQSDEGVGRKITVTVDDRPLIETEEGADWDSGGHSSGGSEFGRCVQRSAQEPVVLFRRRFHRHGRNVAPQGPAEGLMLWIEPVEPADTPGADLGTDSRP